MLSLSMLTHLTKQHQIFFSLSSLSLLGDLGFHEIYHQIRLNLSPDPFHEQI
ncbi:hypothetical protein HanXRQr2_Chr07g0286311 [Helianthus annuus]|uniref:Uncharacterized protein n=1 Tax=Helianthus annuus TaxID=4232 RepID=A0A9K3NFI8_HELAN|nr:hypothetical protein HanXRQr2_Chr07g0286311 [Helianthus annuus]